MSDVITTTDELIEDEETYNQDGFHVVEEVDPSEWIDLGYEGHGECVHLVPDREQQELRCYRKVNDGFNDEGPANDRAMTTIENVRFRFHFDKGVAEQLEGFCLHWREADTFISFVAMIEGQRCPYEPSQVSFNWTENNSTPALRDQDVKVEMFDLGFTNLDGVERHVQIQDPFVADSNSMAYFEERT
jgi:hypothetical protein